MNGLVGEGESLVTRTLVTGEGPSRTTTFADEDDSRKRVFAEERSLHPDGGSTKGVIQATNLPFQFFRVDGEDHSRMSRFAEDSRKMAFADVHLLWRDVSETSWRTSPFAEDSRKTAFAEEACSRKNFFGSCWRRSPFAEGSRKTVFAEGSRKTAFAEERGLHPVDNRDSQPPGEIQLLFQSPREAGDSTLSHHRAMRGLHLMEGPTAAMVTQDGGGDHRGGDRRCTDEALGRDGGRRTRRPRTAQPGIRTAEGTGRC